MTPYRLQTFAPGADEARARALETERRVAAAREEARAEGYRDGRAAAAEARRADEARLGAGLIEALSDARLTNEAARRHVLASLAPVIEQFCAAIAPALADTALFAEIARLVTRAAEAAPAARPRLHCAPGLAPVVEKILGARGLDAEVRADGALGPREARLAWEQGYDHLDLDACVARVRSILAALPRSAEEEEHRRHA
ncbi:hypothetical protein [Amaricoccus solimangrovi]|uniref:Flagellar assembly protein FliH/Type III secretion system HrpE domain-containing protein n=1 Tax=Amaricoccus solimangrovi TaxID=2589815 RepID=A0A501WVP6_9RHOB|nr:hypothetical protein [Amaricoccus solimangrovi]TPE53833.1 hypothetical protein FJM51_01950 [Amaricoccus solimangrovi]